MVPMVKEEGRSSAPACLAAITGQPVRVDRIRAKRENLDHNQHLTGVRAAAAVCQATVKGDTLGSTTLEFIPNCPTQAGKYTFDVAQTVGTGSAGRLRSFADCPVTLALTTGESVVTLKGGTFVP